MATEDWLESLHHRRADDAAEEATVESCTRRRDTAGAPAPSPARKRTTRASPDSAERVLALRVRVRDDHMDEIGANPPKRARSTEMMAEWLAVLGDECEEQGNARYEKSLRSQLGLNTREL